MKVKIVFEWDDTSEPIFEVFVGETLPYQRIYKEIEVDEEVFKKWDSVIDQYYEVQHEIRELVKWDEDK